MSRIEDRLSDPRLTAYAIGELDLTEHAEIEAWLAEDPELQAFVDEVRGTASELLAAFAANPGPALSSAEKSGLVTPPKPKASPRWWMYAAPALAAAAVLFVVYLPQGASPDRFGGADETHTAPVAQKTAPKAPKALADSPLGQGGETAVGEEVEKVEKRTEKPRVTAAMKRPSPEELSPSPDLPPMVVTESPRGASLLDIAGVSTKVPDSAAQPYPAPEPKPKPTPNGDKTKEAGNQRRLQDPFADSTTAALATSSPGPTTEGYRGVEVGDIAGQGIAGEGKMGGLGYYANQQQIATGHAGLIALNNEPPSTDRFEALAEGSFHDPKIDPLSTFSIDVDTASYSVIRKFLTKGRRPAPGAVRIEEMLNYFDYDYPVPSDGAPFSTNIEVAAAPWNPANRLVRIGLRGQLGARPQANLVFLLDVSGSMSGRSKLPLVRKAMKHLVQNLRPDDLVSIVVYAGATGTVLPPTPASNPKRIMNALYKLKSGGSTNGGAGIEQAYWVAAQSFIPDGVNRVILATDGDFNVGISDQSSLVKLIQEKAASGIALTVLGFGMGNYNDATLEKLADKGNGNYAYIDTEREARKVLVDQLDSTLVTIAKDVKIQVEFNPEQAASYRLIGYENRKLAAQDFADDTKDAGEIGAGHTVTALYEIVPAGTSAGIPLKYQQRTAVGSRELLTVKLRYKAPNGDTSKLISTPVIDSGATFAAASEDFRFAAAVASFGMYLRDSQHATVSLKQVQQWAEDALGDDAFGYRGGFIELVQRARKVLR